jgi:type II secretory pathway component PulM
MNIREKVILSSGGILSIILISYGWVWLPYQAELKTLQTRKIEYQNDLAWMQQAALQLKSSEKNLTTILQQRLQNTAIITQPDNKTLHIKFEQVDFNSLIKLLADLHQQYNLSATNITVETNNTETVKAQLILPLEQ